MGLNRCEDAFLDYIGNRTEERRFWSARVLEVDRAPGALETRVALLERELRAYARERAQADPQIGELLGGGNVSLHKLAEYLLATWPPPRPPQPKRDRPSGSPD